MSDSTTFFFAATAAGMRDEDVQRAIELAEELGPAKFITKNHALVSTARSPMMRVFFSPMRLALTTAGRLSEPGTHISRLTFGHVFCGEWNIVLRYAWKHGTTPLNIWSEADGYSTRFPDGVTYHE